MQYSSFVAGLIGVLVGTMFRARALVAACVVTFLASFLTMIVTGLSPWTALAIAFGLIFTMQAVYLLSLLLVYGRSRLAARFTVLTEPRQELQHRVGKTAS